MKNFLNLSISSSISGVKVPGCASLILEDVLLWYDPSSLSVLEIWVVLFRMSVYVFNPSASNYRLAMIFIYLISILVDCEKNVLRQLMDLTALKMKDMSFILGMNSSMNPFIFLVKLAISWKRPLFLFNSWNTFWISRILSSSSNNMSSLE